MALRGPSLVYLLATLSLVSAVAIGNRKRADENEAGHQDDKEDHHGGIKMGEMNAACDNAKFNLKLDWDYTKKVEFTCQPDEGAIPILPMKSVPSCVPKKDIPWPIHKCMTEEIKYTEQIPIGGPHRPIWPVYGEYVFVPPQRWLHSMEHGAAVFLYHPCADAEEIDIFKSLAKSCLRRHIISPSRRLTRQQPFAVVTWGCKLMMSSVDQPTIVQFIRARAIKTEERTVTDHGKYKLGLMEEAKLVSDLMDTNICPNMDTHPIKRGSKLTAEDMDKPYM